MRTPPDDFDQAWMELDQPVKLPCERCEKALCADGYDYCLPCWEAIEREEQAEYDGAPYCQYCGARRERDCDCVIAENH